MRELIISNIVNSSKWILCINNGLEDELPRLEIQSDQMLLELYNFYVVGL